MQLAYVFNAGIFHASFMPSALGVKVLGITILGYTLIKTLSLTIKQLFADVTYKV
jgi:hypothetical protein